MPCLLLSSSRSVCAGMRSLPLHPDGMLLRAGNWIGLNAPDARTKYEI